MSGITPAGFELKRLQEILADMDAALRAELGEDLTLDGEDDVLGQIRSVFAGEVQLLWETVGDLYTAQDLLQAEEDALDRIGMSLKIPRLGDARATGQIVVSGTASTLVPFGTQFEDPDTSVVVESVDDATIGGGGTVTLAVRALEAGPVDSTIDGITEIVTPVTGLDAVDSSTVLTGGRLKESDDAYRLRLGVAVEGQGGTEGAMRAAILGVEGVETAFVVSNRGLTTDFRGTPGKATRIVIFPDLTSNAEAEDAIATAIFSTAGAGTQTYATGGTARTASVLDRQGQSQSVSWEYVEEIPLYVDLDFDVYADETALDQADLEALARQVVVNFINARAVGESVSTIDLIGAISQGVPGARSVNVLELDDVSPPVATGSYTIFFGQKATTQLANVSVSVTLV